MEGGKVRNVSVIPLQIRFKNNAHQGLGKDISTLCPTEMNDQNLRESIFP